MTKRSALLAALSATAIGVAATVSAQVARPSVNKALVRRAFRQWAAGTGSPFDLLAAKATWTIVGRSVVAKTYSSRETFMTAVIRPFNARLSRPLRPTVREIYADGDTVIVLFDAQGTARDGRPYRNTYTWYMQFAEGRVVRVVAFFDSIDFDDFWKRVEPAARQ